ncbi:MAG: DNA mismatch repair endonuclease MutL [Coprobacillus sp.]|nr:DNA mismatch repair endonuclease MutL [Coprobacillus sp.]MDY4145229.1 DNA mismatch repair endonuclease MutL [Bacilli bacterium]
MAKINILNEHLINLIAAGEVIERISSVVKELVENSIDAESTNISISLVDSGLKEICVIDNGIGMDEVEMHKAILPHATSKINDESDLFNIKTLGFRGEALASIVAVSNMKIKSSTGDKKGFMMGLKGGAITSEAYIGHAKGTEIQVRDLFYNTPARLQNLKSIQAELSYVTDFVTKIALANPHIAFKLTNNDQKIFQSFGNGNRLEVINQIYDVNVCKNMITIANSNNLFKISGLISNISVTRSSRNNMTIIVNGRVVRNNNITNAIIEGYKTLLTVGRYPICVIEIDVDYSLVDVNVHPTKAEVRFSEEAQLLELIKETISSSLLRSNLIVNKDKEDINDDPFDSIVFDDEEEEEKEDDIFEKKETVFEEVKPVEIIPEKKVEKEEIKPVQTSFDFINKEIKDDTEVEKITELHFVGQLFGTYILAQNDDFFYMIDQHAANERINYEKIIKDLKNEKIVKYDLLIPIKLSFTQSEAILINEKKETINSLGIDFEEFGGTSFIVRSVPLWVNQSIASDYIEDVFMQVIREKKSTKEEFLDNLAKSLACKRSIKGNEFIGKTQIDFLLEDLVKCSNPYTCPHGRPIIIKYSKYQIEKWFKRVQ